MSDKISLVAEEKPPYSTDENKLLKHFRKIDNTGSKQTVIQAARLAAKADAKG